MDLPARRAAPVSLVVGSLLGMMMPTATALLAQSSLGTPSPTITSAPGGSANFDHSGPQVAAPEGAPGSRRTLAPPAVGSNPLSLPGHAVAPPAQLPSVLNGSPYGQPAGPEPASGELLLAPAATTGTEPAPFLPPGWDMAEPEPISTDWKRFLRPSSNGQATWEGRASGFAFTDVDASVSMPTYPVYGPPPPILRAGFRYSRFDAPNYYQLPDNVYVFSGQVDWMRRLADPWMLRLGLGLSVATDMENFSSRAWRLRGNVFAIRPLGEEWQFLVGAVITGRDDIPLLPAVGAVWTPSERVRVDLLFPRPRVSWMWLDEGWRQQWLYGGIEFGGGTWAYERPNGWEDVVTYREWKLVVGWESTPPKGPFGRPSEPGFRWFIETGLVFGRSIEFERWQAEFHPGSALLLSGGVGF